MGERGGEAWAPSSWGSNILWCGVNEGNSKGNSKNIWHHVFETVFFGKEGQAPVTTPQAMVFCTRERAWQHQGKKMCKIINAHKKTRPPTKLKNSNKNNTKQNKKNPSKYM